MINCNNRIKSNNNITFGAKPIPLKIAKQMERDFLAAKSIDFIAHSSPDQDAVSSSIVLYKFAKKLGKKVSLCINLEQANGLFLPKIKFNIKKGIESPDLTWISDFNSKERYPKTFETAIKNNQSKKIGLDHHLPNNDLISPDLYIDPDARSACGVTYRYFEAIGQKLNKSDLKLLLCGMLDDYKKCKYIQFIGTGKNSKMLKLPSLEADKNSMEVLDKIESQLSSRVKNKVYNHIDIISHLNQEEKNFQQRIYSDIKVTPNGKLAYLVIGSNDEQWAKLGMDNVRTSAILNKLRREVITNPEKSSYIPDEIKAGLKNVNGVIVFYKAGESADSIYKMSMHSKGDYAGKLIGHIKNNLDSKLIAGGHPDRSGGRVLSSDKDSVDKFINNFLLAAEAIN